LATGAARKILARPGWPQARPSAGACVSPL
jgi:hypothetical protein